MTIPWMFSIFVLRTEFGEYILLVLFPVVILNHSQFPTLRKKIYAISKKACKAMFYIQKSLLSDNMNIYGHIKLFNACVQPILLYCSEVWSLFTLIKGNVNVELKYDSFIPNKVQMKYVKYMLGVHKSATHIALLAELGLYPLSIAALKSSVIY